MFVKITQIVKIANVITFRGLNQQLRKNNMEILSILNRKYFFLKKTALYNIINLNGVKDGRN